jgi:hypothetical protein
MPIRKTPLLQICLLADTLCYTSLPITNRIENFLLRITFVGERYFAIVAKRYADEVFRMLRNASNCFALLPHVHTAQECDARDNAIKN